MLTNKDLLILYTKLINENKKTDTLNNDTELLKQIAKCQRRGKNVANKNETLRR